MMSLRFDSRLPITSGVPPLITKPISSKRDCIRAFLSLIYKPFGKGSIELFFFYLLELLWDKVFIKLVCVG